MLARTSPDRSASRGLGGVEVIVIMAVVAFLVICVLIVLPRGRETSRMAGCQRNLMQIGVGVQLYEQANRHYPAAPPLGDPGAGDAPVEAMLKALTIPDFLDLRDAGQPPKPTAAPGRGARVAGLVCPSDPQAGSIVASLGISYRANAGDGADGANGPFSPGILRSGSAVDAADGLSHTAGYAERLLGTGRNGEPNAMNYALVRGPVGTPCDLSDAADRRWWGDAGSSWADPRWQSAIYAHAVPPNAPTSCVAEDGKTATMTASSVHPRRLNVWMLDGSLRGVTPTIALPVWKAMGSIGAGPAADEPAR